MIYQLIVYYLIYDDYVDKVNQYNEALSKIKHTHICMKKVATLL